MRIPKGSGAGRSSGLLEAASGTKESRSKPSVYSAANVVTVAPGRTTGQLTIRLPEVPVYSIRGRAAAAKRKAVDAIRSYVQSAFTCTSASTSQTFAPLGGCVEVLLFDWSGLGDWTPDPLRPRRLSYLWSDCLFSTACHESSSARLVEVCGFELNL